MNFTKCFLMIYILKFVMSLIFMCQFCHAYELAMRKYIDEGKIFDTDARSSSSHVIYLIKCTCGVFLLLQRLFELILSYNLYRWASDRKNFKLSASKKSSNSSKYGK